MKRQYFAIVLVFAIGLGLVMFATASTGTVTLLGMTIPAHVIKGLGLMTMILGILAFLAIYGSSLPPCRAERREEVSPNDGGFSAGDSCLKRLPPTARRVSRRTRLQTTTVRCTVPAEETVDSIH